MGWRGKRFWGWETMSSSGVRAAQAQLEISDAGQIVAPEYITLQATIDRVIFHNPENGYAVLAVSVKEDTAENGTAGSFKEDGLNDLLSADLKLTGHLSAPRQGDVYRFTGKPTKHPRFGKQFNFTDAELILPVGKSGVARYLSQITAGVGVVKAEKIVNALGEDALSIIRENPAVLDVSQNPDLQFLTAEQKAEIVADLTKNSVQAELAALICGPGIGMGTVMRIMREFGQGAVVKIKENPYVLCDEVYGIGFKTADQIALRVGIEKSSPFRVEAALLFVLREAANEGHCYLRPNLIIERLIGLKGKKVGAGLLIGSGVEVSDIAAANERLIDDGRCVREGDFVYLKPLYLAEKIVAQKMKAFAATPDRTFDPAILDRHIADIEQKYSIVYETLQKQAIKAALTKGVSIIYGGPGTGKSEITRAIVEIYGRLNFANNIYLAAPTGKAAKRLEEATRHEASTIHRLLGYNPNTNDFSFNEGSPLPGPGLILVDEFSMVDMELAAVLLAAMRSTTNAAPDKAHQLVIIGDPQQLPSVGPGSVLRDLISCQSIHSTELQFNYRQAQGSVVAERANQICRGEMPPLWSQGDWEYAGVDSAVEAAEKVRDIVANRIAGRMGLGLLDWLCVTPMYKGNAGINELNKLIREIVNPLTGGAGNGECKGAGGKTGKAAGGGNGGELGGFRVGDKLLCTKNSYDLGCFNGDTGVVTDIKGGKLIVDFGDDDSGIIEIPFEHLENFKLGYAVSIHKAQGSQAPLLIMVLTKQNYMLLVRQVIYTGITRAQEQLILVAEDLAVRMAVGNGKTEERLSNLKERIAGKEQLFDE